MYVIKLENDKLLVATIKATIYQYERNADTLRILVPATYEEHNLADCTALLRYVLPNGVGKSEELEMLPEMYKGYLQYSLKVTTKFTAVAGKIELWLSFINIDDGLIMKTGTAFIEVLPRKDIVKHFELKDLEQLDKLTVEVEHLGREKADNLFYSDKKQKLQLLSNGAPIGNSVDMSNMVNDDSVIIFSENSSSDTEVDSGNDAIYF